MRVLIDVDIFLDIFLRREPFFPSSYQAIRSTIQYGTDCFLSAASAIVLAHFLTEHDYASEKINPVLKKVMHLASFAEVKAEDITSAITSELFDPSYISALFVAARIGADYILTRNTAWVGGKIPSITPEAFIALNAPEA